MHVSRKHPLGGGRPAGPLSDSYNQSIRNAALPPICGTHSALLYVDIITNSSLTCSLRWAEEQGGNTFWRQSSIFISHQRSQLQNAEPREASDRRKARRYRLLSLVPREDFTLKSHQGHFALNAAFIKYKPRTKWFSESLLSKLLCDTTSGMEFCAAHLNFLIVDGMPQKGCGARWKSFQARF